MTVLQWAYRGLASLGIVTPYLAWELLQAAPAECVPAAYGAGVRDARQATEMGGGGVADLSVALSPDAATWCGILYPDVQLAVAGILAAVAFVILSMTHRVRGDQA